MKYLVYSVYWIFTITFYRKNAVQLQTVGVPDTSRCVRTYQEAENLVMVVADQLSDVKVLQQQHLEQQGNLFVYVNRILKQEADGMSARGLTHGWLQTFLHLLGTFHPATAHIKVVRTESDIIEDRFFISSEDDNLYLCEWDRYDTTLGIRRCIPLLCRYLRFCQ